MPVLELSHYNLRLEHRLMEVVKTFYVDVLGLRVGPRPAFRAAGYWLYAGDRALLHLTEEAPEDRRRAGYESTFDHTAFESSGWAELRRSLLDHSVPFEEDRVPGTNARQVFFRDPAGNGVELIFTDDEA